MTINPRMNPWEGRYRNIFTAQVSTVTDGATGMILAADQLTAIAESDGRRAVIAALLAVFLILLADFRNFKLTVLTYLPLLMAFMSLYGIMGLLDIKLDFVNIISIPLLVGIGIDDAVHIGHRYRLEGAGGMRQTLAGTGTAVALTTITTHDRLCLLHPFCYEGYEEHRNRTDPGHGSGLRFLSLFLSRRSCTGCREVGLEIEFRRRFGGIRIGRCGIERK